MNKPSKKLLDITLDITGERELEEFPKLLKLYTYALDMEIEIERLHSIINEFDKWLLGEQMMFYRGSDDERLIRFGETKNKWLELKGSGKE